MFIIDFFTGFFRLICRSFRLISALIILACLCVVGVLAYANYVVMAHDNRVYHDVERIPPAETALLLGCAEKVQGLENRYFRGRIDAAALLYHKGRVKKILISGDNSRRDYDESSAMREALIAKAVPADAILLDYAGFRTLDSVVRARDVFGVRSMIIVTQAYHAPRALFLAHENGLAATAFSAPENVSDETKFFNHSREYFARAGAWIDVKILKRKPHFPR